MLTHDRLTEVLHYDCATGIFTWKKQLAPRGKLGSRAGALAFRGRIEIRIDGVLYLGHRLAWFYLNGRWPTEVIDHIDGNPSNNAEGNLREASISQNVWNSRAPKTNTSGVKGVHFDEQRGKWFAQLRAGGKHRLAKRFDTQDEAISAYRAAAQEWHGEFARAA